MLAPPSQRGGPIIWPLAAKLRHPVFLQQRPRFTGGLAIPVLPVLPWNDADRPGTSFGVVDGPPNAADTLPVFTGLAALNVAPIPLKQFLHPQRPRTYYEQFRLPSVVHPLPRPATEFGFVGISRDSTGTPLGGCTVKLYREDNTGAGNDVVVEITTSDANGNYIFTAATPVGATYYVRWYLAGSPDRAGTSKNALAPS